MPNNRKYDTEKKTTTHEGYREYKKLQMRDRRLEEKIEKAEAIIKSLPSGEHISLDQSTKNVGAALTAFYLVYKDEPPEVQAAAIKELKEGFDRSFENWVKKEGLHKKKDS